MNMVLDRYGHTVWFDSAVVLMDDDIRESLHSKGFDDDQAFFDAYCQAHVLKYDEEFLANGVY